MTSQVTGRETQTTTTTRNAMKMGTTNRKCFEVAMTVLAATPANDENHKKQTQSEATTQRILLFYQETQRPRWPPKFQRPTSKLAVPTQRFQSNFFIPAIYINIFGFTLVKT